MKEPSEMTGYLIIGGIFMYVFVIVIIEIIYGL